MSTWDFPFLLAILVATACALGMIWLACRRAWDDRPDKMLRSPVPDFWPNQLNERGDTKPFERCLIDQEDVTYKTIGPPCPHCDMGPCLKYPEGKTT